jgi:hypothetical protein
MYSPILYGVSGIDSAELAGELQVRFSLGRSGPSRRVADQTNVQILGTPAIETLSLPGQFRSPFSHRKLL